jgi:hypothetical protein
MVGGATNHLGVVVVAHQTMACWSITSAVHGAAAAAAWGCCCLVAAATAAACAAHGDCPTVGGATWGGGPLDDGPGGVSPSKGCRPWC